MHQKYGSVSTLIILIIVSMFMSGSNSYAHDVELWTWEKFRIDLAHIGIEGGHELYFENVTRFDDDISRLSVDHQMLGVHFNLPIEGWSVMPSYRYIDERDDAIEQRMLIDFFYKRDQLFDSDWNAKFRFRFETRDIRDKDDITYRFRTKLTLSHPIPLSIQDRPIDMYLSNEVNFDFSIHKINRHRIECGLKFPFTKHIKWTLGYQLETNRIRSGSWKSDSMIMTGFDIKF